MSTLNWALALLNSCASELRLHCGLLGLQTDLLSEVSWGCVPILATRVITVTVFFVGIQATSRGIILRSMPSRRQLQALRLGWVIGLSQPHNAQGNS